MKNKFLGLFGHFNIDITLRVPFLPTKGSVNVLSEDTVFGGTAGNFSIVASSLDIPFVPISAVSLKSHAEYLRYLSEKGIDTSGIVVAEDGFGPVCYSVTDGSEQIYYLNQGPMNFPFSSKLNENWNRFDYLHFGTGPPEDYLEVLRTATRSVRVFDPGQEISYRYSKETLQSFIKYSNLVLVNSFEKEKMKSLLQISEEDLFTMGKKFIVTNGKEGVEFYHGNKITKIRSPKIDRPFDTIGAGDAFRAGLYMGLHEGKSMEEAIAIGNIVASEAIKRPITEFKLTKDEVIEIFEKESDRMIQ